MTAYTFTESRPTELLANLHESAASEREYLFASHDASEADLILVAWSDDQAVGYLAATDRPLEGLLIWEHVVLPDFRRNGLGRRLLLEAAKRTAPLSNIVIDPMGVLDIDRVIDYYTRLGFPAVARDGRLTATARDVVDALGEQREDETTLATVLKRKAPGVETISPEATMSEAIARMHDRKIGALVASHDASRVEGIVSERDVLVALHEHGPELLGRPVASCLTTDVVTATTSDLISEAMNLMTQRRIRHLPVTEKGQLVGIVSVGDLLLFRLEELHTRRSDLPEMNP